MTREGQPCNTQTSTRMLKHSKSAMMTACSHDGNVMIVTLTMVPLRSLRGVSVITTVTSCIVGAPVDAQMLMMSATLLMKGGRLVNVPSTAREAPTMCVMIMILTRGMIAAD